MLMSPATVIANWYHRLVSIGLAFSGALLLFAWLTLRAQSNQSPGQRLEKRSDSHVENRSSPNEGQYDTRSWTGAWTRGRWIEVITLTSGMTLLFWTVAGRHFHYSRLLSKQTGAVPSIPPGEVKAIHRPDGTKLHVEIRGSADLPTVILIHGWSLNSNQWVYLQSEWRDQFRVVVWDLPGLGKSSASRSHDFKLETMAQDLRAVIDETASTSVILLGHSIGGMLILTFCQLYPDLLGSKISKLVLVHTTYTNPLCTMLNATRIVRLQKVMIEPLLYLQIYLWPIVWMMDYLAYWNGSLYWSLKRTGFAGTETLSQLDFVASFYAQDSPAILAQGALAMLAYDASHILSRIKIPVLVVAGEADPITTLEASRKMAIEIERGQIIVLSPAKHFGFIEYHSEFAKQTALFCLDAH